MRRHGVAGPTQIEGLCPAWEQMAAHSFGRIHFRDLERAVNERMIAKALTDILKTRRFGRIPAIRKFGGTGAKCPYCRQSGNNYSQAVTISFSSSE